MGACASRPKRRTPTTSPAEAAESAAPNNARSDVSKTANRTCRRRRILRKRLSSRKIDAVDDSLRRSRIIDRSLSNQPFQDVAWFDTTSALDSECDEEFYSVYDDALSINGSEIASRLSVSTSKVVDSLGGDERVGHDYCGLIHSTCLPCLPSASNTLDNKKRPSSPEPQISRRKSLSKLSFKWREGNSQAELTFLSPKALKQRPIAGSSVPFCPIEKQIPNSWSPIEPSCFKVRGKNYLKDKKKDFAPNCAAFYPIGADVFLSQRKIDHIARFIRLPAMDIAGEVPSILIVNIQIPLYPTTIFQSENDGEGMNVVLYFKLSDNYSKDLSPQFRENISRLINDEVERVKGFPLDTIASFRERLKILGRVANVEDLNLSSAEKKLMNAYNEKPVLSRPQHEFFLGENYLEIDLDVHRFSYIARKGFEAFHERLKLCVLDFGLTIQGNKAEDLPEHILCGIRLNKIDRSCYNQLGLSARVTHLLPF